MEIPLMIHGEVVDIFWKDTFHLYVMVHLFTWFKFYFPLFQTHYHTSPYSKTKEKKIQTKDKIIIEQQHIQSKLKPSIKGKPFFP